jgi:hypothetical protein
VGVWQTPAPLQIDSGVNRLFVVGQVMGRQGVPESHFAQLPAPSHLPFVAQVDASFATHWPVGSIVFAATFEQTPSWPAMQDLHAVLQA